MCLRTCTNMSLKIHEAQLSKLCSAPGSARKVALKMTKVKSDLLPHIDIDITGRKKRIKGGICHSIYQSAKANNKYRKDYDKN